MSNSGDQTAPADGICSAPPTRHTYPRGLTIDKRTGRLLPMSFKPIASPRLYQRIADEIASLIDSGSFKAGERLPAERELAQKMQVSRSSLREALSSLEMSQHVEIRLGSGVYVRAGRRKKAQPSADHASPFDVLHARRLVEGETAALAARNATPSQIKRMTLHFEGLANEVRANRKKSKADREFHLCIARASGNSALVPLVERLLVDAWQPLDVHMEELFVSQGQERDLIAEHRAVLDAIISGDAVAAKRAMCTHLANAERQRMLMFT